MLKVTQVDSFTAKPFAGNPAAVCILASPADAEWMQSVAREMNLSETAFLTRDGNGFNLRWFTPNQEVDLCGHATLASAHVLWEEEHIDQSAVANFQTLSGALSARRDGEWIVMDFPAEPPSETPVPEGLLEALGVEPTFVGKNRLDYIVLVDDEAVLRALRPDMGMLEQVTMRGVIVTSRTSSSEFDFISRYFAPAFGVPEDPVTGSAHCCLGPFWMRRLGKHQFTAYQASSRGGVVRVDVQNDRVLLGGQAVTVLRGELVPESV